MTITESSGNVFADLRVANAADEAGKTDLAVAINDAIKARGLAPAEAEPALDASDVEIAALQRYDLSAISIQRLAEMRQAINGWEEHLREAVKQADTGQFASPDEVGKMLPMRSQPTIRPVALEDIFNGAEFVEIAVLRLARAHFEGLGLRFEENIDDLDHHAIAGAMVAGNTPIALRRYRGHPKDQTTLLMRLDRFDPLAPHRLLPTVLAAVQVPAEAVTWTREPSQSP